MGGWWMPAAAFASMFAQDIVATVMVQSEAAGRAHLAAACDTLQDACGLASLLLIGDAVLVGHQVLLSVLVTGARLAADYSGTYTGVKIGQRIMRRKPLADTGKGRQ